MIEDTLLKDKFWFYLSITVFVIFSGILGILIVKQAENEQYAPIRQQANEEISLMNIRVLN